GLSGRVPSPLADAEGFHHRGECGPRPSGGGGTDGTGAGPRRGGPRIESRGLATTSPEPERAGQIPGAVTAQEVPSSFRTQSPPWEAFLWERLPFEKQPSSRPFPRAVSRYIFSHPAWFTSRCEVSVS